MATLSYNGESYILNHAVKGPDYIHGYDANGVEVVAFEGISDFSHFSYSDTYMSPDECLEEPCNTVKVLSGTLVNSDGTIIPTQEFVCTATGTSKAIKINIDSFTLVDGAKLRFKLPATTDKGITLSVNGGAALPINFADGLPLTGGQAAGAWLSVTYSASLNSFTLVGKGGEAAQPWVGTLAHGPTFESIMGLTALKIKHIGG